MDDYPEFPFTVEVPRLHTYILTDAERRVLAVSLGLAQKVATVLNVQLLAEEAALVEELRERFTA